MIASFICQLQILIFKTVTLTLVGCKLSELKSFTCEKAKVITDGGRLGGHGAGRETYRFSS